jgi:sarcosine oxidase
MSETFEYAVIGLGALGSATAYQLAKRGHSVLGLERFELGHNRGASHDTSRILRHSYHTTSYVELTRAAYDDWAALEVDAGEALVTVTGGLDLFPSGGAIPIDDYQRSLAAVDIPHELLSVEEVQHRWPAFRLPAGTVGLYQERGAIVPAGRGTAVLQARAAAYGAVLRDRSPVTSLRDLGAAGVEVSVGDTTYLCRRVVICADAWTNQLLAGLGAELPLTVTLEQVTYFQPPEITAFEPGHLPLWIWMDEPCFYGFPTYGEPTVKAAQDCGGPSVDPDRRSFERDFDMQRRLAAHMTEILPGSGPVVRSLRCQYTLTPDRDFLIDLVPGSDAVYVGLGAAHGFKFAPTFGRLLADLAEAGQTDFDIKPYRYDRPGLTDPGFETSWMV